VLWSSDGVHHVAVTRIDLHGVCCSGVPYVAVFGRVMKCVAACCSVLQVTRRSKHVAVICLDSPGVCCSILQCVAACCSVLQCVAVCCSVLQCVAVIGWSTHVAVICLTPAVCCSVFFVCCSVLELVGMCCRML